MEAPSPQSARGRFSQRYGAFAGVNALLSQIVPFVPWVRHYRRLHLRPDLIAGLTVAVVAVPQSMAYALIAGLPVQYGLYASIVPTIVGSLWSSSAHVVVGPTTSVSLVVFTVLREMAQPGTPDFVGLALVCAFAVGLIQAGMGMARMGMLLNFVSHSVILGFSAGAAVLIGFKQIPAFLGISISQGRGLLVGLFEIFTQVHKSHGITLGLGLVTVVVVLALKRLRPTWPGALFAMAITGALVGFLDLDARGVAVVGTIQRGLPPFSIPEAWNLGGLGKIVPGALAIAILGLTERVSSAKLIASQTHQRLNLNQELISQGLANLTSAFFSGYPVGGSFTRSAVNFRSGAKTPMSGIVSGLGVALTVLLAAPLAASLPVATLAGILMVVCFEMIRVGDIKRTVRATRNDAAVLVITFLSTLFLSIEFAVYIGVLLSIGLHLATTSHPRIYSTVPDLEAGRMVPATFGHMCCQMDVLRVEGSIFFGSAAYVLEDFQRRLKSHPHMGCLLIRMHQVNNFDASGVHAFELILDEVRRRGGGLYFSGVNTRVFQVFKNSGLLQEIGETHFRSTTGSAIRHAMRESFCPFICAACEVAVFNECDELKKGNWQILGQGVTPRCRVMSGVHTEDAG